METPLLLLKDKNCTEPFAVVMDNAYFDALYAEFFVRAQAAVDMECEANRILRDTGAFTPEDHELLKLKYPNAA